jgi:glycosyltransferase involved in cell wall biosynthesis
MTAEARDQDKWPLVISVIIPVHNGSSTLGRCLEAVVASDYPYFECIVVDDGSTDGSEMTARQFPIVLVRLPGGPCGPAYARNRGAELAGGEVLFFIDADVLIAPGAIGRVARVFEEQPDWAAVFGSYDADPPAQGLVSQYRNLLHHFVHQNGYPEASTFWAGCGAIRRFVFEQSGGFDEDRFPQSSIEDIELGYRLRRAGYRILLDKSLHGTHLKKWTLGSVVRTDILSRAIPWSRLILESHYFPDDLNVKWEQRVCVMLVMLSFLLLPSGLFRIELLALAGCALAGVLVLNRDLYRFFFRRRGLFFGCTCIPLHLIYYLYSGISYLYVWIGFQFGGSAKGQARLFREAQDMDAPDPVAIRPRPPVSGGEVSERSSP